MNLNFKSRKGFTLIELLVVIGILAVLAAIAIPAVAGLIDRANVSSDVTNSNEMTNAIERFVSEYELYCQDLASGKLDRNNFDAAQGRVYNVIQTIDRNGIEILEQDSSVVADSISGRAIYRDTKYPVNRETAKAIVENYTKTSSSTFEPKQSDMHYWYSPDCGIVITEVADATSAQLNAHVKTGKDAKGNALTGSEVWIDLTIEGENNTIPEGGTYYVGINGIMTGDYFGYKEKYEAGEPFPEEVKEGDVYVYGDYEYRYNKRYTEMSRWSDTISLDGWGVRVVVAGQSEFGEILSYINGKPVVEMSATFDGCRYMETVPVIPSTVVNLNYCFVGCIAMPEAPVIPNSVTNLYNAFSNCTFTTAPVIPASVTNLGYTFYNCRNLTGTVTINANPSIYTGTFTYTTNEITLNGSSTMLNTIASKYSNVNVAE